MRFHTLAAIVAAASTASAGAVNVGSSVAQGIDNNQIGTTCTNPTVRPEWRQMTDTARKAYLQAVKCLMTAPAQSKLAHVKYRFDDLQAVHLQKTNTIHEVGQFLPWHRYFLYTHERLLREECSYTGAIPWWDETKDAGDFVNSPLMTADYFGTLQVPTASTTKYCVQDGVFANTMMAVNYAPDSGPMCLSRGADESASKGITQYFVDYCNEKTNFKDMADCSSGGPHGLGHNALGGIMAFVDYSPADPLFYLHHGFIDRNWRLWQNMNSSRDSEVGGYTTKVEPPSGWVNVTGDYTLSTGGIRPDTALKNVLDTMGGFLCYKYSY